MPFYLFAFLYKRNDYYTAQYMYYIYHRHIIYIIYNTYICLIIRFFFIFVALNKKVHKKYRYAYH